MLVTFSWAGFFPWQRNFLKVGAEGKQKNPTVAQYDFGARGLSGDMATQNALPGFFSMVRDGLWGVSRAQAKTSYRGVIGFRCKRHLQRAWLQEHGSRLLSVARGALYRASAAHKQGTRQKILPRRNRILGKWLFRRLAVGNTSKTLGFRNVLWESGLRKIS